MEQIQDNRHCSSCEVTSQKFRVLIRGEFCNIFSSAAQLRSTDQKFNSKSIKLLNIGIRGRSSAAYVRA
jgi:hypothetical protein